MRVGQYLRTVSLEYYRRNRRFIPPDGWELFCVTDEDHQLMMPAIEDWLPIPIPKELGHLEFADSVSHRRGADGVWRWYANEGEPRPALTVTDRTT